MQQDDRATSRRVFVRGALAGLAGTLGAGVVARTASAAPLSPGATVPAARRPATQTKTLYLVNLFEWGEDSDADGRTGMLDAVILRGEVAEEAGGKPAGTLHGTGYVLHSQVTPAASEYEISLTLSLHLPGGTLVSLGTLTAQNRTFAITGGTGDYLGAQGSLTLDLKGSQEGASGGTITLELITHQVLLPMVRRNSSG